MITQIKMLNTLTQELQKVEFNKNKNNATFTTFSQYFYNKSNVVSCY